MPVKILHPSIDDFENSVVIRGILDLDSIPDLKTDFYQRELLPSASRNKIRAALEAGERLPDVVLGMRGTNFEVSDDSETVILTDPVYIIDGQQRCGTIETFRSTTQNPPSIRIGATIHLNTNVTWEKSLFQKLNQYQTKVSPNILLRNNKEDHTAVATLYGLSKNDKTFVLYDRVTWTQNMARTEIMTAATFLSTAMHLHSHVVPGTRRNAIVELVPNSDRLINTLGLFHFRQNIKTFYDLIDECWGIKRIYFKNGAPYMRKAFQTVFAHILSDHPIFWKDDKKLEVPLTLRRKISSFPVNDPEIHRLAGAGGAAMVTLYTHITNHINSGKRTQRIISRKPVISFVDEADTESESEAEVA